jgi:hypothetical protein
MTKKNRKLLIFIIAVSIFITGLFLYLFKDYILPHGWLIQLYPINSNQAVVLYNIFINDDSIYKVGLIDREKGLIWSHDLVGSPFPSTGSGISYADEILTVRYGLHPFPESHQILALNLEGGKELWCTKETPSSLFEPLFFCTAADNSRLYEYYQIEDYGNYLLHVLDRKTGRTLWERESPVDEACFGLYRFQLTPEYILIHEDNIDTDIKHFYVLNRENGEEVFHLEIPLVIWPAMGDVNLVNNTVYYLKEDGLHRINLSDLMDDILIPDYYNQYTSGSFPSPDFIGSYKNELVIIGEDGADIILGVSPKDGSIEWQITFTDFSSYYVADINNRYPDNFPLTGNLLRYIPFITGRIDNEYLQVMDLEKREIAWTARLKEFKFQYIFIKNGFYYLAGINTSYLAVIDGNTGQLNNIMNLPCNYHSYPPYTPANIKDGYLWLIDNYIETIYFPWEGWVVFRADTLEFVDSGKEEISSKDFNSYLDDFMETSVLNNN